MPKSGQSLALSTKKTFNDLVRRAAAKGAETLSLIWKAGETAKKAKDAIPHGEWMGFVETHYDVNHRSVTRWIAFHESVQESKLDTVSNLTAGIKMIEPPKAPKNTPRQGAASAGVSTDSQPTNSEASDSPQNAPQPDVPNDPPKPPKGSQRASSGRGSTDLGKCPNCLGKKWDEDDDGYSCAKCRHPHGEPAGDVDESNVKKQRALTIKHVEATMRAFDDLQSLAGNGKHGEAIKHCKAALSIAKEWA